MKVKINKQNHLHFEEDLRPRSVSNKTSYGNCVLLAGALANNKKILRMRRNSNFQIETIPKKSIPCNAQQIMDTIRARRVSLQTGIKDIGRYKKQGENKERNNSTGSNLNQLKREAMMLQDDSCRTFSETAWKNTQNNEKKFEDMLKKFEQWESIPINLDSLRDRQKSKKNNVRRIIKGRPEIKKLLDQNNIPKPLGLVSQNLERKRRTSICFLEPTTKVKVIHRQKTSSSVNENNYYTIF